MSGRFAPAGILRAFYHAALADPALAAQYWRDEYLLNIRIRHYPKPYVALRKGFVMGGGTGVWVHGSRCIVDETVLFAMPETAIGLFVDVGGSYFYLGCVANSGSILRSPARRWALPTAFTAMWRATSCPPPTHRS